MFKHLLPCLICSFILQTHASFFIHTSTSLCHQPLHFAPPLRPRPSSLSQMQNRCMSFSFCKAKGTLWPLKMSASFPLNYQTGPSSGCPCGRYLISPFCLLVLFLCLCRPFPGTLPSIWFESITFPLKSHNNVVPILSTKRKYTHHIYIC